ncbi:MAG: hypothetical protein KJO65_07000, partial [Gemmatimonadetes bacterium]|nr:hypothetical protein [Gemmatimonadota bacterium]
DLELGGHRGSSAMGSPGAGLVGEGSPVVDEAFPAVDEVTSEVEDPGAEADDASPGVEETSDEADQASHGVEGSPDEASLVEDGSGTVELVDFSGDEYGRASAPESADSSEEADEVTPEPPTEPASNDSDSGDGKGDERPAESPPVDVADLGPEERHAADGAAAPPTPTVASEPSALELELMASATPEALSGDYPEVPDLETVLAEAGIDEVRPPADEEISPPPASRNPSRDDARRPEDRLVFDKDKKGRQG